MLLLWLITRLLPYRALLVLGRALGRLLYRLGARRRHIAATNLRLCFPALDATAREQLLRDHFDAIGIMLFESALSWWGTLARLKTLVTRIEGMEHLESGLARGKGVLLVGAHFTSLELSGRLFSLIMPHPLSGMYRAHENALVDYLFQRYRHKFFRQLIRRDDVRSVLRGLKKNEVTWYAPDQAYRGKGHVIAPFFGVPAATHAATGRLLQMSGATLVFFFCRRLPDGRGYHIELSPAPEGFPSGDDVADAGCINRIFEEMVRQAPEQYFWMHRRFKGVAGREDPYR